MLKRAWGLLLCVFVSTLSTTQVNTPPAGPVTLLKVSRVLDVKAGKYLENYGVVIQGDKIKEVGPWEQVKSKAPAGSKVLDLGRATVLPGLIDTHTHLLSNFDRKLPEPSNMILTVSQMDTAKRALMGAAMAREMLDAGFTAVRDLGNCGLNGDIDLRDAINAGWVTGPRMQASTRALSAAGGQFGRTQPQFSRLIDDEYVIVSGPDEARRAVRNALYAGADVIKVIVDTTPRVLQYDEMKAIVDEAHRFKIKVAAHAVTDSAIKLSVDAGVDSIEHGYGIEESTLKLLHDKGVFLVPTYGPPDDYVEFFSSMPPAKAQATLKFLSDMMHDRIQKAMKAGVRIAAGSDMYYADSSRTRGQAALRTLVAYQMAGMAPPEILRSATSDAAELMGWQSVVGSIEPGHFADLIALEGDPLKDVSDLEHIRFVMKAGTVVRNGLSH